LEPDGRRGWNQWAGRGARCPRRNRYAQLEVRHPDRAGNSGSSREIAVTCRCCRGAIGAGCCSVGIAAACCERGAGEPARIGRLGIEGRTLGPDAAGDPSGNPSLAGTGARCGSIRVRCPGSGRCADRDFIAGGGQSTATDNDPAGHAAEPGHGRRLGHGFPFGYGSIGFARCVGDFRPLGNISGKRRSLSACRSGDAAGAGNVDHCGRFCVGCTGDHTRQFEPRADRLQLCGDQERRRLDGHDR
jgi:hypothetical protein